MFKKLVVLDNGMRPYRERNRFRNYPAELEESAPRRRKSYLLLFIAAMAVWSYLTGPDGKITQYVNRNYNSQAAVRREIKMPEYINAKLYESNGFKIENRRIRTSNIHWDDDFRLVTDRYTVVKQDDMGISRIIGYVGSVPRKLLFLDSDISRGLDAQRTKRILEALENDKSISGVYVRINHNGVFHDLSRLFTDDRLKERNNLLVRSTLGTIYVILGEGFSELSRGDYYNPFTRVAVTYSNIESIPFHELGHHKDFQRFSTDWVYMMARYLPPVMLYQEAKASLHAMDDLKPEEKFQGLRYLAPAFATYVLAVYLVAKRFLKRISMH